MAPFVAPNANWPSVHRDPKWAFPWLDLVISPTKSEGEKEKDDVVTHVDGWAPPEPFSTPQTFRVLMIKTLLWLVFVL